MTGLHKKENCWEILGCGKEPGGKRTDEAGVCPAATEERLDGKNQGTNAGRACWVVSGTLCDHGIGTNFAHKIAACKACYFYQLVHREEGENAASSLELFECLMDMDADIR